MATLSRKTKKAPLLGLVPDGNFSASQSSEVYSRFIVRAIAIACRGAGDMSARPADCEVAIHQDRYPRQLAMECATRVVILRPDGKLVGGRRGVERRREGLSSSDEWKRKRLHPLVSYGAIGARRALSAISGSSAVSAMI
ncbi:hypothetical protein ASD52_33435 [Ensifer sp. Root142]|nr:hypothetical protein ASD00_30385 [Ensifer sp. Root31]KQW78552.1 hypothetical protein ASD03_26075 [Ensifer sp. Root127]KQY68493.1 hypothetical protein ASD52_33435 [Ensifer sp. Root142]